MEHYQYNPLQDLNSIFTFGIIMMFMAFVVSMVRFITKLKPDVGKIDIKPLDLVEAEYTKFIEPYWEESKILPGVFYTTEKFRRLDFKEQERLEKGKRKLERQLKRAKAYVEWKRKQEALVPQVKLVRIGVHLVEKCPICGMDVGSVWPPKPAIRAFDMKDINREVPSRANLQMPSLWSNERRL